MIALYMFDDSISWFKSRDSPGLSVRLEFDLVSWLINKLS